MNTNIYKLLLTFGILLMSMTFLSCSSDNDEINTDNERVDIVLNDESRATADNLKDFYFKVTADAVDFSENNSEISDKNIIISPFSTAMTLAMISNGVDSELSTEILKYTGVNDVEALNKLSQALLINLPKVDRKTNMAIANSLWYSNNLTLAPSFSSLLTSNYFATITPENFSNKDALGVINTWCSNNTNGLIPSVIEKIDQGTLAVILNAVCFNSVWEDEYFNTRDTETADFFGENNTSKVSMMTSKDIIGSFYETEDYEEFNLWFGNNAFYLKIMLPKITSTPGKPALLTKNQMQDSRKEGVRSFLKVHLPKFKISSKLPLADIFECSGIPNISKTSKLTMFSSSESGILDLNQSTSLEIDESGTKVAATTVGEVMNSAPSFPHREIFVNRSFYFFINEVSTGTCILSGRIADL